MRIVAINADVIELEAEQIGHLRVQPQRRQRARFTRQLLAGLFEVVRIQVRVAQRVHEIADAQTGGLRHHVGQQRVAGDVERHAQEDVAAALVELAAELAVHHIELEQVVARHQRHLRQLAHVPGTDHQPARIGVALDLVHQPLHLVDRPAIGSAPAAPLLAVDRAEVAVGIGPFVPDPHLVVLQVPDVGIALQEPQQLMDDRAQVQFLGGDQRKAVIEVEAHLPAEHAARAGAGAVGFFRAVLQHVLEQRQVGLHALAPAGATGSTGCSTGARRDSASRTRPKATSGRLSSWPRVNQSKAR